VVGKGGGDDGEPTTVVLGDGWHATVVRVAARSVVLHPMTMRGEEALGDACDKVVALDDD